MLRSPRSIFNKEEISAEKDSSEEISTKEVGESPVGVKNLSD